MTKIPVTYIQSVVELKPSVMLPEPETHTESPNARSR